MNPILEWISVRAGKHWTSVLQSRNKGKDLGLITPLSRIDNLLYWALPFRRFVIYYTPIYSLVIMYIIYDVRLS